MPPCMRAGVIPAAVELQCPHPSTPPHTLPPVAQRPPAAVERVAAAGRAAPVADAVAAERGDDDAAGDAEDDGRCVTCCCALLGGKGGKGGRANTGLANWEIGIKAGASLCYPGLPLSKPVLPRAASVTQEQVWGGASGRPACVHLGYPKASVSLKPTPGRAQGF
eukprot:365669-Chlamydomonas_euryale.AAC.3